MIRKFLLSFTFLFTIFGVLNAHCEPLFYTIVGVFSNQTSFNNTKVPQFANKKIVQPNLLQTEGKDYILQPGQYSLSVSVLNLDSDTSNAAKFFVNGNLVRTLKLKSVNPVATYTIKLKIDSAAGPSKLSIQKVGTFEIQNIIITRREKRGRSNSPPQISTFSDLSTGQTVDELNSPETLNVRPGDIVKLTGTNFDNSVVVWDSQEVPQDLILSYAFKTPIGDDFIEFVAPGGNTNLGVTVNCYKTGLVSQTVFVTLIVD